LVIAAGVDDERKRLLVISAETDARGAALAQADIQSATPEYRVVVARPVIVDLPGLAQQISTFVGRSSFAAADLKDLSATPGDQQDMQRAMQEAMKPLLERLTPMFGQWFSNAQGVGSIGFRHGLIQTIQQLTATDWLNLEASPEIELGPLSKLSPIQQDQALGTCPIPLYAFSGDEMEVIQRETDEDSIGEVFRRHGVLQYFFPAADQVALGMVDRANLSGVGVAERLQSAPALGHPFGSLELVPAQTRFVELVDALKDRGLVVEAEFRLEVTPEGQTLRQEVIAKPREALIFKVLNNFKVSVDLKSLFRLGG
jgi:hypothetical protein